MTIQQIRDQVSQRKPVSTKQIYRYFKACKIRPLGLRQRPQHYPDDSAERILARLGLRIVSMNAKAPRVRITGRRAA